MMSEICLVSKRENTVITIVLPSGNTCVIDMYSGTSQEDINFLVRMATLAQSEERKKANERPQ